MSSPHFVLTHSEWAELQRLLKSDKPVVVDGHSLTIAGVVAVALYVIIVIALQLSLVLTAPTGTARKRN